MSTGVSWLDFKLGVRMLARYPALTLVGGLGLAVAIAISVGAFAFLTANVYPNIPLDEGDRIVALENRDVVVNNEERRSLHDFVTWRDELQTLEDIGAFRTVSRNLITGEGPPEVAMVAEMSAAGFQLARVAPLLGRYLLPEDERVGAERVIVIGHDLWQRRFGADPGIVGKDLRLGSAVHTVVGVMPPGFAFPMNHEFWTPLRADPAGFPRRDGPEIFIFARLAPGVSMERAQAELDAIGRRTAAAYPESHGQLRPMVMPYTHSLTDIQGATAWFVVRVQLMLSLLLVVVALNVGVLVYARTAMRQGEIAVRAALGASRSRVIAQLFAEALVLSLGSAAVGLGLAQLGVGLGNRILELGMGIPFWTDYSLQPRTVFFTVVVAVATAVIIGILPALQATGQRLQSDLRQLGGGTGMRLGRTWTILIVSQVAIAVAALPVAVNLGWGQIRGATTRPNYATDEFLIAGVAMETIVPPEGAADVARAAGAAPFGTRLDEVMRRLEGEPQVVGASFRANLPGYGGPVEVEGVPPPLDNAAGHRVSSSGAAVDLLDLYGLQVLTGRGLEAADAGAEAVAVVVNRAFVQQVLGGEQALGRRVRYAAAAEDEDSSPTARAAQREALPERWFEIVGVVENLQANPWEPELVQPELFYPVAPEQVQSVSLSVRVGGENPAAFAGRVREVVAEADPTLRLGPVRLLADSDRESQTAIKLVALIVGLVLLSVLLLSSAGIYALTSFTVTRRRKELGIRAALGAQPRQVLGTVFARSGRQISLGLLSGIAGAALIDGLSGGSLLGGNAGILLPFFGLLMALVGLLAALGPARRGLRIPPTEALRADA